MSKVHYFQRYSQRENVVTNNTLLLLSRLYNDNPLRFEDFINSLLNDFDVNCDIGPTFTQQQGNKTGSSTPDGAIVQKSLKVLIETKLYDNQDKEQLLRHLDGFGKEDTQVLLLINPTDPSIAFNKSVLESINEHNDACKTTVRYCSVTFKKIIEAFDEVLPEYDIEMQEILSDFRSFCTSESLLPNHEMVMRAITSGGSFSDNMKYNIYYDDKSRGYSPHDYLGLYTDKSVRAIGKITKVVQAQYNDETKALDQVTLVSGDKVTDADEKQIVSIMHAAMENNAWNVYQDHNFFIVDQFHKTDFNKTTKYPIQRTKFFDLGEVLDLEKLPECAELANRLEETSWG